MSTLLPLQASENTPLLTCLLEGPSGTGKTALAATVAIESGFPFVKVVSAETMIGFNEASKASAITKVFDDAYKVGVGGWEDEGPGGLCLTEGTALAFSTRPSSQFGGPQPGAVLLKLKSPTPPRFPPSLPGHLPHLPSPAPFSPPCRSSSSMTSSACWIT
jgi:hypothetical protein